MALSNSPAIDVVSFSGGRTSAYLVHLLEKRRTKAHSALLHHIFMDTGAEHPKTYEFIRNVINLWNIPVTLLRVVINPIHRKASTYAEMTQGQLKPDLGPYRDMLKKYGTPYIGGARCTDRMKSVPYTKYCQENFGKKGFNTWLGIRFDEPARLWGEECFKALLGLGYRPDEATLLFNESIKLFREDAEAGKALVMSKPRLSQTPVRDSRKNITTLSELMIKGLVSKVDDRLFYLSEISDFEKDDVKRWWASQPFDLGIDEHLGNCVFCIKKSKGKVALAARDEPEMATQFISALKSDEVKIEENRAGRHLQMYRDRHSLEEVIALFNAVPRDELASSLTSMKRYESGGCSESCMATVQQLPETEALTRKRVLTKTSAKMPSVIPSLAVTRPVFKWAGGKFSVLDEIAAHMPAGTRLIEPFVGGGSIFMNLKYPRYLCADINDDLITTYRVIKSAPDLLIGQLKERFANGNTPQAFREIKERFNREKNSLSIVTRAADFIYLNRHCFNGLIRYNRSGEFNVSFAGYKKPYAPINELVVCAETARRCDFMHASFAETIKLAGEGDVIFCDPPYEPMPGSNGFTQYSAAGFNMAHQEELVMCLKAAYGRGARAVVTNSSAPNIEILYRDHGLDIYPLRARRSISAKGSARAYASDIIAVL